MSAVEKALKVYFVSGASRGLGLEFVRQLSAVDSNFIFAGARNPDSAKELKALQSKSHGRVELVTLDVSDLKSIEAAGAVVQEKTKRLDVLINNAGAYRGSIEGKDTAPDSDPQNILEVFQTNVIGVHAVTQTFLPLLDAARKKKRRMKKRLVSNDLGMGKKLMPRVLWISRVKMFQKL